MSSEGYACEVLSIGSWPASVSGATPEAFIDELERLLACDAALKPFALAFDAPVPVTVREQVSETVLRAVKVLNECDEDGSDWVDDLVDESGWQGVRATVDDALAPRFAGRVDGGDERHCGVWTDDRTFLHLELDALHSGGYSRSVWAKDWVRLAHWHPGSMTSGSWSDDLFLVDPGSGPGVLLEVRHFDDDGEYYTLAPLPSDPKRAAELVTQFVTSTLLWGAEDHLLSLLAHGFPMDGSADSFSVDLLEDTDNPGYELSRVRIDPPADVREHLVRRGALGPAGARALHTAVLAGAAALFGAGEDDDEVDGLGDEWVELLARLEAVAEGRAASTEVDG
jgi:hypothetical protein